MFKFQMISNIVRYLGSANWAEIGGKTEKQFLFAYKRHEIYHLI